jgi:argininosuccinate lyase
MKKLWDKGVEVDKAIEKYTVGKDRELDLFLAKHDVTGSLAHITMLCEIGLLEADELKLLKIELLNILETIKQDSFVIEDDVEDVHSQVELMLTRKLGDVGKKIHSGRSRNDQVLVDLKLFMREELTELVSKTSNLFNTLQELSEKNKDVLMPGYTHMQVAMPSSFGLWFGAFAESLSDDMRFLLAAYEIVNQNPLGSAAGYGSSFPLNRTRTTELLGFETLSYNVVYAQMGRGRAERSVAIALASIASTIGKLAADACLFMSQNFGFISLPNELTTGSSIMPHKKNPDIFEVTRAKCNKLQSLPADINNILINLSTGYFRDLQVIKEIITPAFAEISEVLDIVNFAVSKIEVNTNILDDDKYKFLFSVEEVNKLVLSGVPFRDAYKKIGNDIEAENYNPSKEVKHTHEGSIGNLCTKEINEKMQKIIRNFNFAKTASALEALLSNK